MKTKKLTLLALLTGTALILSYVESMLPSAGIPGVKMGLANIAVIFALYRLGWREALEAFWAMPGWSTTTRSW